MGDVRKIAEKLAARRITFAKPRAPSTDGIDRSYEILSRYPTVTILCVVIAAGLMAMLVGWILALSNSGRI